MTQITQRETNHHHQHHVSSSSCFCFVFWLVRPSLVQRDVSVWMHVWIQNWREDWHISSMVLWHYVHTHSHWKKHTCCSVSSVSFCCNSVASSNWSTTFAPAQSSHLLRASSFLQQVAQTFALARTEVRPLFINSERVRRLRKDWKTEVNIKP